MLVGTNLPKQKDYAKSLIEANKRTNNIIAKSDLADKAFDLSVNSELFQSEFETTLNTEILKIKANFNQMVADKN